MAFDRSLYFNKYDPDTFPHFPCPKCPRGMLFLDKESLSIKEPQYSIDQHLGSKWDPELTEERFIAFLICSNQFCGEIAAITGNVDSELEYLPEQTNDIYTPYEISKSLRLRSIFPVPQLFDIPKEIPKKIEIEIMAAFQLYWSDLGACANRLRISVESILDDLQIPAFDLKKSGYAYRIKLNDRISEYKKIDPDHAATMDALRLIGNVGSHEGDVAQDTILDAFQIYEDTLAELYGKRSATMQKLKQRIIDSQGEYQQAF